MIFFDNAKRATPCRPAAARYRLKRKSGSILRDMGTSLLTLAATFVLSLLMVYGFSFVLSSPYLETREILVRGCKELTEKQILALAAIEPSRNLLIVDVEEVGRRVKANPWIEYASVGREYPDRVVIEVRERKPVALLKRDDALFLVDREGNPFKELEQEDEMDLPILTGFYRDGKIDRGLLAKSLDLLRHLGHTEVFPNIRAVSEIHGNERLGLSLFTNTGLCLLLGFDSFENKFKRLPTIMADLDRRNKKTAFLQIDLSDPVKVTVQQRNIMPPSGASPDKAQYKT